MIVLGVEVAPTLTWVTEPPTSVEQDDDITFKVGFSDTADYYFRIENSTCGVVWRSPTSGTLSAKDPTERKWTTTTATPTGNYTIIININGADNSDTRTITVTAAGGVPAELNAVAKPSYQTVNVSEEAYFYGGDSTGGIERYEWDFGDGTNDTGSLESHAYSTEGRYTVTLTVYDVDDNSDSDTCEVSVIPTQEEYNVTYNFTEPTPTEQGFNVSINETGHITGDDNLTELVEIDLGPGNGTLELHVTPDPTDPMNGTIDYGILDIEDPVENPSLNWSADIYLKLDGDVCGSANPQLAMQPLNKLRDVRKWDDDDVDNATTEINIAMAGFSGGFDVKAVMNLELSGISESDVLSLPINMTVDGAWYRDEADSNPNKVFLFKFDDNGTVKERETPLIVYHDADNDEYTFYFEMSGFSTYLLVGGKSAQLGGGDGDGGGTYPPGWFATPTVTATAVPGVTATAAPGVTPGVTPPEEAVTTPTKPAVEKTPAAVAEVTPTKKKWIPGFTAVFAIAGLLAVAYVIMRRRD
jgi:PGF-CTERM protein